MKSGITFVLVLCVTVLFASCKDNSKAPAVNIIYLHHSTGGVIWKGNANSGEAYGGKKAELPQLFKTYNETHNTNYLIKEMEFPKSQPYGWTNDPYDYYNIWVINAGGEYYLEEPTLEMLTKNYQVIIFKHCFPVTNIQADLDTVDINSKYKTVSNYKLQYTALRDKLLEFPDTKFIIFTGATQVKANMTEDEAKRAKEFFLWVRETWDRPGDNIYLWDLYSLQTEGGLYFRDEYAVSVNDSHPNKEFASKAAKLLFSRIIDVIENNGNSSNLAGESK